MYERNPVNESLANDDASDADEFIPDGGARGMSQPGVFKGGSPDVAEESLLL